MRTNTTLAKAITVTEEDLATAGLFTYIQILKIIDEDTPTLTIDPVEECINSANCSEEKTFSISAADCSGENLVYEYELKNSEGTIVANGNTTSFSSTVSNQKYELKWTVNDNCGNTAWEVVNYEFKDCKNPSPYCLDGIAIEISDLESVSVWASDLTQNSSDNCTASDKLEYRLYHPALGASVEKPAETATTETILALPQNITFDCSHLGTQEIELYVVDEAGNWDYCVATADIQDNLKVCSNGNPSGMASLVGNIKAVNGENLSEVIIMATDGADFQTTIQTDVTGKFDLSLPQGEQYNLVMTKEDELINGLSVFDIILVSKHILGISRFDSPFQYIAADFNSSGSITAFDMVQMRQVVLGISTNLTQKDAWRFASATITLEEMNGATNGYIDPFQIDMTTDITNIGITGIKLGDLNNSVKIEGLLAADSRMAKSPLIIHLNNQKVQKGELVTTKLVVNDLEELQGLQFGLEFDGLTLQNIEEGTVTKNDYIKKTSGGIVILWDKYNATLTVENTLIGLTFIAEKSGELSEFISLADNFYSEVVDSENNLSNVTLAFDKLPNLDFELYQNTPNPFSIQTNISFQLSQPEQVTLEIFTLQGKLLYQQSQYYQAGLSTIQLAKADIGSTGILVYQLKSSNGLSAKKMIVLD